MEGEKKETSRETPSSFEVRFGDSKWEEFACAKDHDSCSLKQREELGIHSCFFESLMDNVAVIVASVLKPLYKPNSKKVVMLCKT